MSLFGVTNVRRCWKTDSRISQIADNMTINRYEEIKRFLSFVDCSQASESKLFKFKFLIDHFRNIVNKIPKGEFFRLTNKLFHLKQRKAVFVSTTQKKTRNGQIFLYFQKKNKKSQKRLIERETPEQ